MATNNMDDKPKAKYNSVKDVPLTSVQDRVQPRQVGTGAMRGAQTIVNPADGSKIVLGKVPGAADEFGISYIDGDGTLVFKFNGVTLFMYDSVTGDNTIQFGRLPDGTVNLAIAKEGYTVDEAITP